MGDRIDEHVPSAPAPGAVSDGGVDAATGATTGALTGALFGASGGTLGFLGGALLGGLLGGLAAAGPEHPYVPEHWQERRESLSGPEKEAAPPDPLV